MAIDNVPHPRWPTVAGAAGGRVAGRGGERGSRLRTSGAGGEAGDVSGRTGMDGLGEVGVAAHAVAVPADVDDVAAMQKPVEQRRAAMTSSPRMRPHSSKPLLEVSTVEACS